MVFSWSTGVLLCTFDICSFRLRRSQQLSSQSFDVLLRLSRSHKVVGSRKDDVGEFNFGDTAKEVGEESLVQWSWEEVGSYARIGVHDFERKGIELNAKLSA